MVNTYKFFLWDRYCWDTIDGMIGVHFIHLVSVDTTEKVVQLEDVKML
jgi:hypothetical protein